MQAFKDFDLFISYAKEDESQAKRLAKSAEATERRLRPKSHALPKFGGVVHLSIGHDVGHLADVADVFERVCVQ